jgi:spore germination cell wall hydrolase CwlJ-like protein
MFGLEVLYLLYELNSSIKISTEDVECLAINIYHEARGEPIEGQIAVGHVVFNRVKHKSYPNSICEVVKQAKYNPITYHPIRHKCHFSWYCDGKSDKPKDKDKYSKAIILSKALLLNIYPDNTCGATHYFNPHKVNPKWANNYNFKVKHANHVFYGDVAE